MMGPKLKTTSILGANVSCLDQNSLFEAAFRWSKGSEQRTILYANAHCLNTAAEDAEYLQILNQADILYADGISVVWASRFLSGAPLKKMTGRAWITAFCRLAEAEKLRMYILGSAPGIAQLAAQKLQGQYPALAIVGSADGYFKEKSEDQILEEIAARQAQLVFVGMGTPRQEKWLASHRAEIAAPVCWAVGALFDYVAGIEPVVPKALEQLGCEWLWRLYVNPREKWKRYLIGNPLFILRIAKQKMYHFNNQW